MQAFKADGIADDEAANEHGQQWQPPALLEEQRHRQFGEFKGIGGNTIG